MINSLIENVSRFLEKQFQALSIFNSRVVLYSGGIYGLYALHHFFPSLYTLYTFENATYLLLAQGILLILHKRSYVARILPLYLRHISAYFEVTNFFLAIVLFVGVYIFTIQGVGLSDLTGFLVLFIVGSLYNFIYKNEDSTLFTKERIDILALVFVLSTNIGIYLFLSDFLIKNSLETISSIAIPATLVLFNVTLLILFTDTFERLGKWYQETIAGLPRKTAKRWRLAETVIFPVVAISLLLSGGYFGYGYYTGDTVTETAPLQETAMKQSDNESTQDFLSPIHEEQATPPTETGSTPENNGHIVQKPDTAQTATTNKQKIRDVYTFNRYIGIGDAGKDVTELQKILKENGFYSGAVTGKFDIATGNALSRFIQVKTGNRTPYTQLGPKALTIWNAITIEK